MKKAVPNGSRQGFTLVEVLIAASIAVLITGSAVLVLQSAFRLFGHLGGNQNAKHLIDKSEVTELLRVDMQGLLPARKDMAFAGSSDAWSGERLQFIASADRLEPVAVSWRRHGTEGMERVVKRIVDSEGPVLEEKVYPWILSFQYGRKTAMPGDPTILWADEWSETNSLPVAIRFRMDGEETLVPIPGSGETDVFDL